MLTAFLALFRGVLYFLRGCISLLVPGVPRENATSDSFSSPPVAASAALAIASAFFNYVLNCSRFFRPFPSVNQPQRWSGCTGAQSRFRGERKQSYLPPPWAESRVMHLVLKIYKSNVCKSAASSGENEVLP